MDIQMFTIRDLELVRRRSRLRRREQSELRNSTILLVFLAITWLLREAYLRGWL